MRGARELDRSRLQRRELSPRRSPQDAEARVRNRLEPGLAVPLDEPVIAVAEESEVVICQPPQQRLALREIFRIDRRRTRAELADYLVHPVAHRTPVLDHAPNLVQDPLDACRELVASVRIGLARDLGMEHGLRDRVLRVRALVEDLGQVA